MLQVILGGGISGLSAGYYLSRKFFNEIKIYESSNRVGGWIRSVRTKNGSLFELGPRTLRAKGEASENALELVEELGLSSSLKALSTKKGVAKNRLIYFNNQLICAPFNISFMFKKSPLMKPFMFGILKDLRTPKATLEDESIYNFVERRFGKDYAENLLSPLICGIFGGDAKEISVKSLMNDLFQKEQEYGSVICGFFFSLFKKKNEKPGNLKIKEKMKSWSVWSLENGLETLPIQILKYLEEKKNVEILLEKKCSNVVFKEGEVLLTVNGNVERAQHLYSSLPSKELAKILGDEHSFLKSELLSVPFVSIAVVNLEYDEDLLEREAFGLLVPPNQNLPILGIIFDSCIFEQKGKTVLTVMMGGRWFEQHFGSNPDKETLLKVAKDHVKLILNIDQEPSTNMVTVLKEAIPQYVVGHSKRVQGIREYIKKKKLPLTLIGNSFDGIGVSDTILSAKNNVESALKVINLKVLQSLTFGNVQ